LDFEFPEYDCTEVPNQELLVHFVQVAEAFERIKTDPGLRIRADNDPTKIFVPPRGAIANQLVKRWLQQ
jgi:hypothetical protein